MGNNNVHNLKIAKIPKTLKTSINQSSNSNKNSLDF